MEYKYIHTNFFHEFTEKVNKYIEEGYKLEHFQAVPSNNGLAITYIGVMSSL